MGKRIPCFVIIVFFGLASFSCSFAADIEQIKPGMKVEDVLKFLGQPKSTGKNFLEYPDGYIIFYGGVVDGVKLSEIFLQRRRESLRIEEIRDLLETRFLANALELSEVLLFLEKTINADKVSKEKAKAIFSVVSESIYRVISKLEGGVSRQTAIDEMAGIKADLDSAYRKHGSITKPIFRHLERCIVTLRVISSDFDREYDSLTDEEKAVFLGIFSQTKWIAKAEWENSKNLIVKKTNEYANLSKISFKIVFPLILKGIKAEIETLESILMN